MSARTPRRGGGRPPKFDEPRRPVTVTLPIRTLDKLASIDPDRAAAIVKLADAAVPQAEAAVPLVDVVGVAPGIAVLLVAPSRHLRSLPLLQLVEIGPERHLLAVPSGTAVETLEVSLADLLDRLEGGEERERAILEQLLDRLRELRRSRSVSKAEILFVHTKGATRRAPTVSARPTPASAIGSRGRRRSVGRRSSSRDP